MLLDAEAVIGRLLRVPCTQHPVLLTYLSGALHSPDSRAAYPYIDIDSLPPHTTPTH